MLPLRPFQLPWIYLKNDSPAEHWPNCPIIAITPPPTNYNASWQFLCPIWHTESIIPISAPLLVKTKPFKAVSWLRQWPLSVIAYRDEQWLVRPIGALHFCNWPIRRKESGSRVSLAIAYRDEQGRASRVGSRLLDVVSKLVVTCWDCLSGESTHYVLLLV